MRAVYTLSKGGVGFYSLEISYGTLHLTEFVSLVNNRVCLSKLLVAPRISNTTYSAFPYLPKQTCLMTDQTDCY